jgi:CDP-6-deoxy-D-xylo-4-hexulose-3-dehydrase
VSDNRKREIDLRKRVIKTATAYYEFKHKSKKLFAPGDTIHYAGRGLDDKEISAVIDSSLDFWLTTGKYAEKFENNFAKFLGIKHCCLTNSGSSANLLAFMALTSSKLGGCRIKKGDEVITVAAAFPTTVAPIIQYGAVPVFLDVVLPTYNIDWTMLDEALSPKTRAVMVAHTLGNPFDIAAVKSFCDKHDLWLIEDNCDALGSRYKKLEREDSGALGDSPADSPISGKFDNQYQYTGTFGQMGTSSFYPPHHMTMGEGGAVYTNDDLLKRIVESFRDWGKDCWCPSGRDNTCKQRFTQQFGELPQGYDHKYVYSHFGYNLKVTDMQAAIGCAQLGKLPGFIETRKKNWKKLHDGLSDLSDVFILPEPTKDSDPSWFGFALTIRENAGFTRDEIVDHLEKHGIQTRMLFGGNLLKQPCFDEMRKTGKGYRVVGNLSNTDMIMKQTFWVGVYPGLTGEMLQFIIERLRIFVKKSHMKSKSNFKEKIQ